MDNKTLQNFKNLLIEEKMEIIKEIMEADESVKDLIEKEMHNVNDSADAASNQITQNILNIVNINSKKTLLSIDAALKRIEEQTFGYCVVCNKEIEEGRLKVIPWAIMCIACKNKKEKSK